MKKRILTAWAAGMRLFQHALQEVFQDAEFRDLLHLLLSRDDVAVCVARRGDIGIGHFHHVRVLAEAAGDFPVVVFRDENAAIGHDAADDLYLHGLLGVLKLLDFLSLLFQFL